MPHLVRTIRGLREGGSTVGGELAALVLVLTGQQQPLVTQQPQHGRLGHLVPVMAGQRPDLAMPPRRFGQRMPNLDGIATARRLTRTMRTAGSSAIPALPTLVPLLRRPRLAHQAFYSRLTARDSCSMPCEPLTVTRSSSPRKRSRRISPAAMQRPNPRNSPLASSGSWCSSAKLTNADIADELGLTISTVKTYVSRLLLRLDLTNRTTLAAHAHEWGIVD